MEKVKVGIAGLGRSGWGIHADLLGKLPEKYQVVAVCDPDKTRRGEAEKRFKCRSYPNLTLLLKDKETELIVIATPSTQHATNVIQALKTGKNVVCEKPMATKLSDADQMIEIAKKTKKILSVFQNRRYAPDFVKVREVINSGKLGRIVLIKISWNGFSRRWDWQTLKKFGGGTLNNTCPHAIDQALQLLGEEEPKVFCHLDKTLTLGDADDHVKIVFQTKKGPMVDLEVSSCCAYPQDIWCIMGTKGGLHGDFGKLSWKFFNPAELPKRKVETAPTSDRSYNSEKIPWQEETWELSKDKSPGSLGFYTDLYHTLKKGKPLLITPESARRVMWVIEKCHKLGGM
ncbi:MAG: Gfo/Idh/MocA family oxidoreductase [Candidatus Omnitrophota bacterium]|nr:Gfo/Idh/MocA family oxidoreductase [Candidatus Omnitrophota bacterium]